MPKTPSPGRGDITLPDRPRRGVCRPSRGFEVSGGLASFLGFADSPQAISCRPQTGSEVLSYRSGVYHASSVGGNQKV